MARYVRENGKFVDQDLLPVQKYCFLCGSKWDESGCLDKDCPHYKKVIKRELFRDYIDRVKPPFFPPVSETKLMAKRWKGVQDDVEIIPHSWREDRVHEAFLLWEGLSFFDARESGDDRTQEEIENEDVRDIRGRPL